jgi:hypothetical protein
MYKFDPEDEFSMHLGNFGNIAHNQKTCPNVALSTTYPTWCPDANPGRRGGKPATNRLSYGTA